VMTETTRVLLAVATNVIGVVIQRRAFVLGAPAWPLVNKRPLTLHCHSLEVILVNLTVQSPETRQYNVGWLSANRTIVLTAI